MQKNHEIKIRYNNTCTDGIHYWRGIIDGVEYHFSDIEVNVFSWTSKDFVEGVGEKWHITCTGYVQKEGEKLIINPFPTEKDWIIETEQA